MRTNMDRLTTKECNSMEAHKMPYSSPVSNEAAPVAFHCISLPKTTERGLAELQLLLAELPNPRRRQAISRLSRGLKAALLDSMLKQKRTLCTAIKPAEQACGVDTLQVPNRSLKSRGRGCVSELPLGGSQRGYIARVTINGVAVSSRCMKTREDAQSLLDGLLASVTGTHRGAIGLVEACSQFEKQWNFRVLVDARIWTGRVLSSRRLHSAAEALALRKNLEAARTMGWETLRAAWARCMSRSRRGGSSKLKESRLQTLDRGHLATQKQRAARKEKRCELRAARAEKRLARLLPRLEHAARRRVAVGRVRPQFEVSQKCSLAALKKDHNKTNQTPRTSPLPKRCIQMLEFFEFGNSQKNPGTSDMMYGICSQRKSSGSIL